MFGSMAQMGAMVGGGLLMEKGGSAALRAASAALGFGAAATVAVPAVGAGGTAAAVGGGVAAGGGAVAAGPVILIGAAILATIGVAVYGVYHMKQLDGELGELLYRIDALDYEETRVEGTIDEWKQTIETLQTNLETRTTEANTGSKMEKMKGTVELIRTVEGGVQDLHEIKEVWDGGVKKFMIKQEKKNSYTALTRIFIELDYGDVRDFDTSLTKVIKTYDDLISQEKRRISKLVSSSSKPIEEMMVDIRKLDEAIKTTWAKPRYTDLEKKTFDKAIQFSNPDPNAIKEELTPKEVSLMHLRLVKIKAAMIPLLEQAKKYKAQAAKKKGNAQHSISKRAVTIPSPEELSGKKTPGQKGKKTTGPRIKSHDNVRTMQEQINNMSVAFEIALPQGRLTPDGAYGPKTAAATIAMLNGLQKQADQEEFPERAQVLKVLKDAGINKEMISNIQLMNRETGHLGELTNRFANIWEIHRGIKQRPGQPGQQQEPAERAGSGCNSTKANPNPTDIIACFKTLVPAAQGELELAGSKIMTPYNYAKNILGLEDREIVKIVKTLFGGKAKQYWNYDRILIELNRRDPLQFTSSKNPPGISKRADAGEVIKMWVSKVWNTKAGLFENLAQIIFYASPAWLPASVKWPALIIGGIGTYVLGIRANQIGKAIDDALGGSDNYYDTIVDLVNQSIASAVEKDANYQYQMTKNAGAKAKFIDSIIRGKNTGKMVANMFKTLITYLVVIFGTATIDDVVRKIIDEQSGETETSTTESAGQEDTTGPAATKEPEQKDDVRSIMDEIKEKKNQ